MTGVEPAEIDSGDLAVAIGQHDLDKTLQVESLGGDTIKRGDSECSLTLLMCDDCCGESNPVIFTPRNHSAPTLPGYPLLPQAPITRQYSSQTGYGGIGLLTQPGLAADTSSLTRPYSYR